MDVTFGRFKRTTPGPLSEIECISLSFLSDNIVEDSETFTVQLNSTDPLVMLFPQSAEVVILDNDRKY